MSIYKIIHFYVILGTKRVSTEAVKPCVTLRAVLWHDRSTEPSTSKMNPGYFSLATAGLKLQQIPMFLNISARVGGASVISVTNCFQYPFSIGSVSNIETCRPKTLKYIFHWNFMQWSQHFNDICLQGSNEQYASSGRARTRSVLNVNYFHLWYQIRYALA